MAEPFSVKDATDATRAANHALAEALPDAQPWVLPGAFDEASGHSAGRALLESTQRPDAVFAANDMMALGCLFAFNQAGLRVPDDIALAGFDDIPLARYVHPALTTMRVDIATLGGRALRALLARTGSTTAQPAEPLLLPELVVRESTVAHERVRSDSS